MNQTCIIILSIVVIGCYSVPMQQRTRRQAEAATEVSEETELSLGKLETFDSESKDKQDSLPAAYEVVESDKEKVGDERKYDDKNNDSEESEEVEKKEAEEPVKESVEEYEKIEETREPSKVEEESGDSDEEVVEPKGVQELYQESKAEYEKNDKEEESGDELQSAIGDVAPAAGGMFSTFSQMWQTVTTLGSSWEHWTRIFNAFTALAGF